LFSKRTSETNMTSLIRRWSMDGARSDLVDRFRSSLDIHAIVAARSTDEPSDDVAPPTRPEVLLKPAGEDDWRPLLVGEPA
jgi:hypothetical protein